MWQNKKQFIKWLKQGDVLNTLNGGHVEPQLHIKQNKEEFVIEVLAPGVSSDLFHVILDYHRLNISLVARHPYKKEAAGLPLFSRSFHLPGYIDYDQIMARYQPGRLEVILPFRNLSQDQRRRISIQHL